MEKKIVMSANGTEMRFFEVRRALACFLNTAPGLSQYSQFVLGKEMVLVLRDRLGWKNCLTWREIFPEALETAFCS